MPATIYNYIAGIINGFKAGGDLTQISLGGQTMYITAEGTAAYPWYYILYLLLILVLMIASVIFVVVMTSGERRIPVQYAKRVVGRKMYGGQATHIPIKVNMSGVMPVIFASSLIDVYKRQAMRLAAHKLPIKCKFVKREEEEVAKA